MSQEGFTGGGWVPGRLYILTKCRSYQEGPYTETTKTLPAIVIAAPKKTPPRP